MTAPERIWAEQNAHGWIALDREPVMLRLPEYVRADLVEAQIAAAVQTERARCAEVARDWTKHNVFSGIGEKKRFDAKDVQQSVRTATILCADDIMKGPDND